jgi:hypothetical protein
MPVAARQDGRILAMLAFGLLIASLNLSVYLVLEYRQPSESYSLDHCS